MKNELLVTFPDAGDFVVETYFLCTESANILLETRVESDAAGDHGAMEELLRTLVLDQAQTLPQRT